MDIRDPIEDEDEAAVNSRNEVRLVEVGARTEQRIKRSFTSMSNNDRHQLRNAFALPNSSHQDPIVGPGDGSAMLEEHEDQ